MLVSGGFNFFGIRLFDEKGEVFVKKVWSEFEADDTAWVTKEIYEGQEIIGLQAYTDRNRFCRIGWVLWVPKIKDRKIFKKEEVEVIKVYKFDP